MRANISRKTISSIPIHYKTPPASSLRFRLMCGYVLILAIVLCAFSTVIYVTQEHALYYNANDDLQPIIQGLPELYDPQPGHLANTNIGMYAYNTITVLLSPQGRIIQALGRPITPSLSQLPIHFVLSSSPIHYQESFSEAANPGIQFSTSGDLVIDQSAPLPWNQYVFKVVSIYTLVQERLVKNYVLVGLSTAIPEEMSQLLNILLLMTFLTLLVSSAGGYWLASKASRSVQSITRATQEINEAGP
jgi:two-component system OmpR family sensor kinase